VPEVAEHRPIGFVAWAHRNDMDVVVRLMSRRCRNKRKNQKETENETGQLPDYHRGPQGKTVVVAPK